MRKKTKTAIMKEVVEPNKNYAILRTTVTKGKEEYVFFDVKYGSVIITGCRVVVGRKGDFLAMPSKEHDGEYYPVVYLSHELGDALMNMIEEADDNGDWEEVEDDFHLRHEETDKKKAGKKKAGKRNEKDEEEEEEEDEKPKKKKAADYAEDYAF